jgi:hypothetical protein
MTCWALMPAAVITGFWKAIITMFNFEPRYLFRNLTLLLALNVMTASARGFSAEATQTIRRPGRLPLRGLRVSGMDCDIGYCLIQPPRRDKAHRQIA